VTADLLGGARPPGLYATSAGAPLDALTSAGWEVAVLDGRAITDAAELLAACAAAWRFPDWYGANFDALADCLADLSWLPAPGYALLWRHAEILAGSAPDTYVTARQAFSTAAARRDQIGLAPLYVLLAGLPDPDLPTL
jgi:RNAse (barnase) inhibitor barstar